MGKEIERREREREVNVNKQTIGEGIKGPPLIQKWQRNVDDVKRQSALNEWEREREREGERERAVKGR